MANAAGVINTAFCWIEGAASIDFFLAKQILTLDPNNSRAKEILKEFNIE